ncbi:hypothetical protein [Leptolyngbya sp. FACHB-261]|uniref:hypothetical protein n=1 Tax=Leptolyngbya sp. FACHB-261 TaxID=2692806 RepID=UPI00168200A2|nr:hypothetical protein [Leptolyngbya sp. FACHB-261]MBD2103603.1 hypothetical protein [Leptolyngbya sp. FACHB-261]
MPTPEAKKLLQDLVDQHGIHQVLSTLAEILDTQLEREPHRYHWYDIAAGLRFLVEHFPER